jgi:hypothetical protein
LEEWLGRSEGGFIFDAVNGVDTADGENCEGGSWTRRPAPGLRGRCKVCATVDGKECSDICVVDVVVVDKDGGKFSDIVKEEEDEEFLSTGWEGLGGVIAVSASFISTSSWPLCCGTACFVGVAAETKPRGTLEIIR